jgi:hypothetical protein
MVLGPLDGGAAVGGPQRDPFQPVGHAVPERARTQALENSLGQVERALAVAVQEPVLGFQQGDRRPVPAAAPGGLREGASGLLHQPHREVCLGQIHAQGFQAVSGHLVCESVESGDGVGGVAPVQVQTAQVVPGHQPEQWQTACVGQVPGLVEVVLGLAEAAAQDLGQPEVGEDPG